MLRSRLGGLPMLAILGVAIGKISAGRKEKKSLLLDAFGF